MNKEKIATLTFGGLKIPIKVAFLTWIVALRKILELDNYRERDMVEVECCCVCKKNGHCIDHLLLHCVLLASIVSGLIRGWVMRKSVVDLLEC